MHVDRHESICHIIDKSFAGGASAEEQRSLREHLLGCASCAEYLAACQRAIAGLQELSFEMDPGLEHRVLTSLTLRARQLEATRDVVEYGTTHHRQSWRSSLLALLLTAVGSVLVLQLSWLAASVLHVELQQVQRGLVAIWIIPSLCFCVLFLLLPVSSKGWIKLGNEANR